MFAHVEGGIVSCWVCVHTHFCRFIIRPIRSHRTSSTHRIAESRTVSPSSSIQYHHRWRRNKHTHAHNVSTLLCVMSCENGCRLCTSSNGSHGEWWWHAKRTASNRPPFAPMTNWILLPNDNVIIISRSLVVWLSCVRTLDYAMASVGFCMRFGNTNNRIESTNLNQRRRRQQHKRRQMTRVTYRVILMNWQRHFIRI